MFFRTEYIPSKSLPLDPAKPVTLIGSCFSDNIGAKMLESGWDACVNPCGVLYNPASIAAIIHLAIAGVEQRLEAISKSLTPRDGRWASWLFSGHFGGNSEEEAIESCNDALNRLRMALRDSQALIITLGTAYVYYRDRVVVSNCHKYPEAEFSRTRLSTEECKGILEQTIEELQTFNTNLRVIFTVSPVRHLRDGFADNARSKATLLLAVGELTESGNTAEYFPAFEILTDDLRDYRFYADDLLHPSQQGIGYIWEKFRETYLTSEGVAWLKTEAKKIKASAHKTLFPGS